MPKSTTRSYVGQNSRDSVKCLSITQRNDQLPGMAHWLPTVAGSAEDAGMEPAAGFRVKASIPTTDPRSSHVSDGAP
jgi:hypothetical protein